MPTLLGLTNDTHSHSHSPAPSGHNQQLDTQNKFHSKNTAMGGSGRLDTISKRNHHAAREVETLFWRALCDSPDAAKEYMADDCIMINPLFSGSDEPMSKDTDPSIDKILEGAEPWSGFRFHGDPLVVEIDLMAVGLVYKVTLFKSSRKGGVREVTATCSSSWRQTAGADWLLTTHHCAYADVE